MKLCKDCKHFDGDRGYLLCQHPRLGQWVDLVEGKNKPKRRRCAEERARWRWPFSLFQGDVCGPEGRYFEARDEELVRVTVMPGEKKVLGPATWKS